MIVRIFLQFIYFFFQAEDGIRDFHVTGVQTCALPICAVKQGDEVVGNETRVKVVKNKVAPPFKQAEFQILYGSGINRLGEILDLGVQLGLIDKSGAWYAYNGDKIGQGKQNACDFLKQNPQVAEELEVEIRARLLTIPAPAASEAAVEADD